MKKISDMSIAELRDAKHRYGTLLGGIIYTFYLFAGVIAAMILMFNPSIGFPIIGITVLGWIIFVVYRKFAIDNELKRR